MTDKRTNGRRPERWSFTAGEYPNSVRVYERTPGAPLYVTAWDPTARDGKGGERKRSLARCRGFEGDPTDRGDAKAYALAQAAKLERGLEEIRSSRATVRRVLALYLEEVTAGKCATEQKADRRRDEMWRHVVGPDRELERIGRREWDRFITARSCGAIDARGNLIPDEKKRRPVRARTVAADLIFLQGVVNWACAWRDSSDRLLLRENPVKGLPLPEEKNPRRPVASDDRFEVVRSVADRVRMQVVERGKRRKVPSYLLELLDLAHDTGRRLSAIRALTYQDLRFARTNGAPHGAIRWPEDTDKMGKEWEAPIGPEARAALERVLAERPGIGKAPIFPAPGDPSKPVSRSRADKWLRRAEKLAGLEPQKGGLWHPYRRGWASRRKHLPDVDVAAAGGWSDLRSLKTAYQRPDAATLLRVVLDPTELREMER